MNELAEMALVQILSAWPSLSDPVGKRILWDDSEVDVPRPCVRLRTLATTLPGAEMQGRGGMRRCLVEMACDDDHSTMCSKLADAAIAAVTPYQSGPFSIFVEGVEVRFGSIVLQDVQQSRSLREKSYRKTVLIAVWFYE